MSITKESELLGMNKAALAVASTLRDMISFAKAGMSTLQLDAYGAKLLHGFGARSAPHLAYAFPGHTCISVNEEVCHGIPSARRVLREGDLVNIDVSAELDGYWADNGASFVLGKDIHGHQALVDASRTILNKAVAQIRGGTLISDIGYLIESESKKRGFKVIRNLAGHGIGRRLHEQPDNLLNYRNKGDRRRFKRHSVIAIETFISTDSFYADILEDGWTMVGNKGGFVAQHEHTLLITEGQPVVLTDMNGI